MPAFLWRFLPHIGIALLAGLLVWGAINKFNSFKAGLIEQGRVAGYAQAEKAYRDKVAENDRVNRAVEQKVSRELDNFAEEVEKARTRIRTQAEKSSKTLQQQIKDRPEVFDNRQCDVPEETIRVRNSIRALGPTN